MAEKPKYLQVADSLRREIVEGSFRDGDTLCTEEILRMRFQVSRQTIRQAIALLEDDGLVERRRGSGTYVRHGPRRRQGLPRICVLTGYITDYISPEIISGIERVISERGAVMTLSATRNDPAVERALLERMMEGQIDGLIAEGCRTGGSRWTISAEAARRRRSCFAADTGGPRPCSRRTTCRVRSGSAASGRCCRSRGFPWRRRTCCTSARRTG